MEVEFSGVSRMVGIKYLMRTHFINSVYEGYNNFISSPPAQQLYWVEKGFENGMDNLPIGVYLKHFGDEDDIVYGWGRA